jgi:hypothetical protein
MVPKEDGVVEQGGRDASSQRPPFSGRAKALIAVLLLQLVVTAAFLLATIGELALLRRVQRGERVTLAEAGASDDRVANLAVLWVVSWLVAVVVWLVWQHRAHRRVRQLGVQGLRFTPGWGVGWWFVPFANLVKPYQSIKELWLTSAPATKASDPRRRKAPAILPWWWAAFLISGFLDTRSLRAASGETIGELIVGDYLSIGSDLTWILAGILALAIVREIDRGQSLISPAAPTRPDLPAPPGPG